MSIALCVSDDVAQRTLRSPSQVLSWLELVQSERPGLMPHKGVHCLGSMRDVLLEKAISGTAYC